MDQERIPPRLPVDEMTGLERAVLDAARLGEPAGLLDHQVDVEELAVAEGPGLCVRAELIRDLLLGRHGELDPRGVLIEGVRVLGLLDLDRVTAVTGLALVHCALPEGITCRHAGLPELILDSSLVSGLFADGFRTEGHLFLRDAVVRSDNEAGAVRLHGAHIGSNAEFNGGKFFNDSGPALDAENLRTDGHLVLHTTVARGSGKGGAVRLHGAHIGGNAEFDGAEFVNDSGPALTADFLRTDGHLFLHTTVARGSGKEGTVSLHDAHIGGQADFDGVEFVNDSGPALTADYLRTAGDLFLCTTVARGSGEVGTVRLHRAHIGGSAEFDGAEFVNDSGPALAVEHLRTDSNLFLRTTVARGSGKWGAVRLHSARIGGTAEFDGAEFVNDSGPALDADYLRTDGALFLRPHVDDDRPPRKAVMSGSGEWGAVRLHSARIGGQAVFDEAVIANGDGGPLIVLADTQVDGMLFLPATVVCPQGRLETGGRPCPAGVDRKITVRGLVFSRLGHVSWRQWLHLLVHHTPEYLPQPYQQLAAVERAAGHDGNARHVLIVQQEDLRRRDPEALGGRLARVRHRLWGWLGRYGYRAHRLVLALAVVLALAGGTGYTAGQITTGIDHHAAERVRPVAQPGAAIPPGTPCSTVELIGLGIDRGLPLGVTGLRARCDLDTSTTPGQVFTVVLWVLQALLWALATLTVAAYTGLIRKPA
ncbi:hypothetical protein FHS29_004801 [Saccharothrix tamanrassetensis]|uniref:Membrane-associated oxidoreductase n=1 Tax=Saccharothrix tamanrassetensis TaxID=1051531 RepID=A0A841CMN9_9PSEU|nr:hypothetical protein [Saccharothrix tamanrassetensis]MBB5958193.1 hypothetical protein [Saccharothrix tamanrassetensis]